MLVRKNNSICFDASRCTQCGVCLAVCRSNALSVSMGKKQYNYSICNVKCVSCGLCTKICSANLLSPMPPNIKDMDLWKCYIAWAKDKDQRYNGSSGGFCRATIHEVLEKKLVTAVYTLRYHPGEDDVFGEWIYSNITDKEIPQSQYRVVCWGRNLAVNCPKTGRVLLVGLPCQLRAAINLLEIIAPKLDVLTIAIMCRKTKQFGFSKYIMKECGYKNEKLINVRYRGKGWPGRMRLENHPEIDGIDFRYHAHCWNLSGCMYCYDGYYMEGNLTVSDPWGLVERNENEAGKSLLLIHNHKGERFLNELDSVIYEASSIKKVDYEICLEKYKTRRSFFKRIFNSIKAKIGELFFCVKK